ncbi:MAG: hypothetical protein K2K23_08960 [Muribaculaceae bacterium]|nr:hypothetical protein [Muribaculaceae bacterium]
MTKAFKYIGSAVLFGAAAMGAVSCSEDTYSLPSPDITPEELVEGVAFSVEHDAQNPNIIHLKSLMPAKYNVAWVTPQGRRSTPEVTLQIPFDGEYEVQMGVNTRGGYVWSNPYSFTVDDFCAEFVDNYLWKRISGGVGQSKTWQLDLAVLEDGSTKTTYWGGPHWYWNPNYTWDHLHAATETETTNANYRDSDPWDAANAINPDEVPSSEGEDNAGWYWAADYAGNSWMCSAENYGYITFDLINGANVTISDADGNVIEKGTYLLDVENHTIAFSGVYPLNSSNNGVMTRDCKLLYLSDTAMQLIPDGLKAGSATSLNYVTKDYFDNYHADESAKEPELPEGWREDVSQTVITSVKWVLSDKNPLDWANLDGSLMNGWRNPEDYPDWLGTPDPASYADFSMTLDSDDNSAVFTYPDGSTIDCTYELSDNGTYTFSEPIKSFSLVGWASFAVDANNGLRILSIEKNVYGNVTGVWLGALSSEKPEYMAYHFVPTAGNGGGGSDEPAYAATLSYFSSDWSLFVSSEPVIFTKDGTYTATVEGTVPESGPGGMFLDVPDILLDYPNADVIIKDVKLDGNSISFSDEVISRGAGDDPNTLRRYFFHPWGLNPDEAPKYNFTSTLEVTFEVKMDTGEPFIKPE